MFSLALILRFFPIAVAHNILLYNIFTVKGKEGKQMYCGGGSGDTREIKKIPVHSHRDIRKYRRKLLSGQGSARYSEPS
ncbi:MAG: hypothetical protein D3904_14355 [Candidatus Electrothrix sp. EH2]|nr:hypothetical protein [Candidatus Electrothrix sp. EH2]